jgi:hypothetical protein
MTNYNAPKPIKPCIACKKELTSVFPSTTEALSSEYVQPDSGVSFSGYGGYGSVFDDIDNDCEYVVNICDECLTSAIKNNEVLLRTTVKVDTYTEATS